MKRGLTNIYVKTCTDFSILAMESTGQLSCTARRFSDNFYEFRLDGDLIMAPDILNIYDGLINTIKVARYEIGATVSASLQYPSAYYIKRIHGIPERLEVYFDRSHIKNVVEDKLVIIDPGHGGGDAGKKGYINLLEKNVVKHIAGFLKEKLILSGARAVLSREKDISMSLKDRLQMADMLQADLWVSIHTHWDKDKQVCGTMAFYHNDVGESACKIILEELDKKLKLASLGIRKEEFNENVSRIYLKEKIPFVTIEVCTISNPVEEGWLRSSVFKERVAQAIANGIVRYFESQKYKM